MRDIYTLIRGGIRKPLPALGYTPSRRTALGERHGPRPEGTGCATLPVSHRDLPCLCPTGPLPGRRCWPCSSSRASAPRPAGELHLHDAVHQAARAAQKTREQRQALRERSRPRANIERKISELCRRHRPRQGRYRRQQMSES